MKTLYLVRHAKALTGGKEIKDADRSLRTRGIKDAYLVANEIKAAGGSHPLLICSDAVRTVHTALIFTRAAGYDPAWIRINPVFYRKTAEHQLAELQKIDNEQSTVMIFCHEPHMTDLITSLTGKEVREKFRTCTAVRLISDCYRWEDIPVSKTKVESITGPAAIRKARKKNKAGAAAGPSNKKRKKTAHPA